MQPTPNPILALEVMLISKLNYSYLHIKFVAVCLCAANAKMPLTFTIECQGLGPEVGAVFVVIGV